MKIFFNKISNHPYILNKYNWNIYFIKIQIKCLHNFNTKNISNELNETVSNLKNDEKNKNIKYNENVVSNKTEEIIEKYKKLIENKKNNTLNENKKNEIIDDEIVIKQNLLNEKKKQIENEIKKKELENEIKKENKFEKKEIEKTDEKYVILKKQITKEFIYKVFLPHVESQIIYHLKTYTPQQIVNILHIYSYLYFYDKKKEMINELLKYIEYRLDCFNINNIINTLEPLYILNKINNIYIYRLIINRIKELENNLNIYNYIGISRVFTKILIDIYAEENCSKNFFLKDVFNYLKEKKNLRKLPENQKNISNKMFFIEFMNEVIEKINKKLNLLTAIELTDILSVMANYSQTNYYSKYNVEKENEENNKNNINELIIHDLSLKNSHLFKENIICFMIINEIKKKYNDLVTLHKIVNLYNMIKLCIYDEEYLNLIETNLNNYHYIHNIHHKYLTLLIWCFYKLNIFHKYKNILLPIIKQNINKFSAKDLSRLCHSIFYEKKILNEIANNLIIKIKNMEISDFICYFYSIVLLDLLPFNINNNINDESNICISNKNEMLHNCLYFIDKNKKNLGKDEITKIVLLLKKKKDKKYLYILDMLPKEWNKFIHLIN